MTTTRTDARTHADDAPKPGGTTGDNGRVAAMGNAAQTVVGAASDAVSHLPEVAATTRTAIEDADRQMRAGSDEMLAVGSALSFGLASGLLIAGANRIVVAAMLLPAAMMVLTLFDRSGRARNTSTRRLQGG